MTGISRSIQEHPNQRNIEMLAQQPPQADRQPLQIEHQYGLGNLIDLAHSAHAEIDELDYWGCSGSPVSPAQSNYRAAAMGGCPIL
jgi:hypothetical protein